MSLPILCNACNKAKLQGEYHYGDYCTCKPTAADRLTGIRAWVASSNKSTAHHSIKDDGLLYCAELLSIIAARDKELEQVKSERDRLKTRLSVTEKLLPRAGRDY